MKSDLSTGHCQSCEGIGAALTGEQVSNLMPQLSTGWCVQDDSKEIKKTFSFADFYETMAFVNAIAWISHLENHHPDLELGYNYCHVRYSTHALKGLSHNDFICAAKIDKLLFNS